jgi:ferrous iron transport protein B
MKEEIKVALIGNPNCGKTTIFNKLTKSRHKVGNYPGVTVEKKEGYSHFEGIKISVIDLPGVYSLTSHVKEEVVARDYILREKPDIVVNIVDASHLDRSLYLTTELMELEVPIVLVCNKIDIAKKHKISIDIEKLSTYLEIEAVETIGKKGIGIKEIFKKIVLIKKKKEFSKGIYLKFSKDVEGYLKEMESFLKEDKNKRFYSIKLLEEDPFITKLFPKNILEKAKKIMEKFSKKEKISLEEKISFERHEFLEKLFLEVVESKEHLKNTVSDKIDKILTNKFLGIPIFFILMFLVFQFTFTVGAYPTNFLSSLFSKITLLVSSFWKSDTLIHSLIVDGIIGGVGSVLVFLPNILLLFIAISLLEESGYMARAAFVMDRVMHKVGLHGKSFLPMLIGFGCTVPAVMSTRILENKRDRLSVILVLPLICCSAKLAVFTLIIPAFFSPLKSAILLFSLYFTGIFFAVLILKVLRKGIFKGDNMQFIMEMPTYQMPSFKGICSHTFERAFIFLKKAGTIILGFSILLWFLSVFPKSKVIEENFEENFSKYRGEMVEKIGKMDNERTSKMVRERFYKESERKKFIRNYNIDLLKYEEIQREVKPKKRKEIITLQNEFNSKTDILKNEKRKSALYHSYIGRFGKAIEPLFKPLGFDWRIDIALFGALSAKEIFISQLGVIFAVGEESFNGVALQKKLRESYSPLTGLCVLLFILISAPCLATIVMTKRETNSWGLAIFQLIGLTLFAYFIAFLVHQIGIFLF